MCLISESNEERDVKRVISRLKRHYTYLGLCNLGIFFLSTQTLNCFQINKFILLIQLAAQL